MSYKFELGEKVVVLNGRNIPDYAASWAEEMEPLVGKVFYVAGRYRYGFDGRNAYDLVSLNGDSIRFTFDERGLRRAEERDTWMEYKHGFIHNNKKTHEFTIMIYHGTEIRTEYIERLPENISNQIMPEEPFVFIAGRYYRVSTLESSEYFICPDCGMVHSASYGRERAGDGRLICRNCCEQWYRRCDDCGKYYPNWDTYRIHMAHSDDRFVCTDCVHNSGRYVKCQECGEWFPAGYEFEIIDGRRVCELCAPYFQPCPTCGRLTRNLITDPRTGEDIFCSECYVEPEKFINGYHHLSRRELKKHGVGPCYIGTELEVEKANSDYWERNDVAGEVISKLDSRVYCERDGSLFDGFEIISEPHTVEEYFKLKWEDTLQYLIDNGYTSHNNGRCGLHIHFSNEWFGDDEDEIDDNVAKVIHLYSKEYEFFLKCSRRSARQADEWASRYVCDDFEDAKANKSGSRGHHVAVNLDNMTSFGTVEFRLGRGTLIWESYKAWIDIHIAIVKNSRIVPKDCTDLNLWLKGISEETKAYIKERTDIDIESEVA